MSNLQAVIIHHFETIDSTQKEARRRLAACDRAAFTVFSADAQSDGIGTHGRKWHSPPQSNLYLSMVFFLPDATPAPPSTAQAAALSVARLLLPACPTLRLKWPNDLIIDGRKVGGILVEGAVLPHAYAAIVGVGLNVNADDEALAAVPTPATSLLLATGRQHDRVALRQAIINGLAASMHSLLSQGFASLVDEYTMLMTWHKGAAVTINTPQGPRSGLFQGLDAQGRLLLATDDGLLSLS